MSARHATASLTVCEVSCTPQHLLVPILLYRGSMHGPNNSSDPSQSFAPRPLLPFCQVVVRVALRFFFFAAASSRPACSCASHCGV